MKKIKGYLSLASKGYGFVTPVDKKKDIFIPKNYLQGALDNDFVEVKITQKNIKGPEGKIIKVLQRHRKTLVATVLYKTDDSYFCLIYPKKNKKHAYVKSSIPLQTGDRISVKITSFEKDVLTGIQVKVFGNISDPSIDIEVALEEYLIKEKFSKKAILEAEQLKPNLDKRKDFSTLECFTIDPATAKDFDDAISCEITKKNTFYLGVHIADVASYVFDNSDLDQEAISRGNSTYFPGKCIPMLPFKLSNDLCSLKENELKACISCMMEFNAKGDMQSYEIVRSIIKSKKRFTYEEAYQVLSKKLKSPHFNTLKIMENLFMLLKKKRIKRGSVDLALPEAIVEVTDKGDPLQVKIVEYDISHQMIEEFMLKANECVAKHLADQKKELIYRVHEKPGNNFQDFFNFAKTLGFKIPQKATQKDAQILFSQAKKTPYLHQLSIGFIKSMKLAMYSKDNFGHYGLALEYYCHFTSPIRRYSDLVIQRLLFNTQKKTNLEKTAKICSTKERISFQAEMSVVNLKKIRLFEKLFKKNPNTKYKAIITKIHPFSITFEIESFLFESTIHISEIDKDYYTYDPKKIRLKGSKKKSSLNHGDKITLKIIEIDLNTQDIQWQVL